MGMLVGLFCIGWLAPPGGSATHPPLQARLRILLEQIGTQDAARFWDFAVGLLFVLTKDRKSIQITAGARANFSSFYSSNLTSRVRSSLRPRSSTARKRKRPAVAGCQ